MEHTCDHDHDDLLLPHDVLIQILVCLPVISLLRFKTVCKSWRALIDSAFFIHLHATTTLHYSSKFGSNFIFQRLYPAEILMVSAASRSHGGGDNDDEDQQVFEVKSLGFPAFPPQYRYRMILMVGSCNGLICLHGSVPRDIFLWNPATKQFRILPKSLTFEEGIGYFDRDFIGFGFDVKTKDYKVVQITYWFRPYKCGIPSWRPLEDSIVRVQVYSLSTDSWRFLEGINSLPARPIQGLYLNGSYFFLGSYNRRSTDEDNDVLILSFDFTKEIFTTMQFPVQRNYNGFFYLTYLAEKIAIFATGESDDIWVLNEHGGVKEPWTKLHSNNGRNLRVDQLDSSISNKIFTPRGTSNNGEFAFIYTRGTHDGGVRKFGLFNLVTAKMELPISKRMEIADVYKQSLVSIGGNEAARTGDSWYGRHEPAPLLWEKIPFYLLFGTISIALFYLTYLISFIVAH